MQLGTAVNSFLFIDSYAEGKIPGQFEMYIIKKKSIKQGREHELNYTHTQKERDMVCTIKHIIPVDMIL